MHTLAITMFAYIKHKLNIYDTWHKMPSSSTNCTLYVSLKW